ncbi:MAG TPA: efflux RND transporter periplasmic adaptor subunit [Verrucomicrobiae bacterium]
MDAQRLAQLQIEPAAKRRPQRMLAAIFLVIALVTVATGLLAWPRASDKERKMAKTDGANSAIAPAMETNAAPAAKTDDRTALTVSGYIINRERIEISPRFLGVVKWIGVKKGDPVTNGQVIVQLDDAEYLARVHQADGALAAAKTGVAKAELFYQRIQKLSENSIDSKQTLDDARLQLDSARASVVQSAGELELARTYLGWCTIRSPIDGVILEKLVQPNELVMPQSFGGTRGPSTALVAMADPKDLQVEIDVNEADLSKISMDQKCRVSPEAYPDKTYGGHVAEIAPEADRSKGTLQIKVQIENPDRFLTPELSAKVDFLKN